MTDPAHTPLTDAGTAPPGRCGYILDRTPHGPTCGRPAQYVITLTGHTHPAGACPEHAQRARRMPQLAAIRSWP